MSPRTDIRIALVPLDERPVNTRYPQMLGKIGGAQVLLPGESVRGLQREPSDRDAVAGWLRALVHGGAVDAVAASADYLAYGNLINARISADSAMSAMARLGLLEEIGARTPIHVFSLITRVANANDNVEEPAYWKEWGTRFHLFASLTHRDQTLGLPADERRTLGDLAASLPVPLVTDWLNRRLRNHSVNLALVDLAARGRIDSLLLTSDDTSPFGFATRERDWLSAWLRMIGSAAGNVRMHPGADEVGSALVARLINAAAESCPKVWVEYSMSGDERLVAPYEDRPVCDTVLGQIEACGCIAAGSPGESDFVLAVATPSPRRSDYRIEYSDEDRSERGGAYDAFLRTLAGFQREGMRVALADVAYPNGSDPLLSEKLLARDSLFAAKCLIAYGAWNTAGNTVGTVVAQAACALRIGSDSKRKQAQRRFLTHRFLEDYGYQQRVRREARQLASAHWNRSEPDPNSPHEIELICGFIEERLRAVLTDLQSVGIGVDIDIVPGSVRLPWKRTFEVDFDLAANDSSAAVSGR